MRNIDKEKPILRIGFWNQILGSAFIFLINSVIFFAILPLAGLSFMSWILLIFFPAYMFGWLWFICIVDLYQDRLVVWSFVRKYSVPYSAITKVEFSGTRFREIRITFSRNGKTVKRRSGINQSEEENLVLLKMLGHSGLVKDKTVTGKGPVYLRLVRVENREG